MFSESSPRLVYIFMTLGIKKLSLVIVRCIQTSSTAPTRLKDGIDSKPEIRRKISYQGMSTSRYHFKKRIRGITDPKISEY